MVSRSWTASALQDFLDSLMTLWAFGVQNLSIDGEKTQLFAFLLPLYWADIAHGTNSDFFLYSLPKSG